MRRPPYSVAFTSVTGFADYWLVLVPDGTFELNRQTDSMFHNVNQDLHRREALMVLHQAVRYAHHTASHAFYSRQ